VTCPACGETMTPQTLTCGTYSDMPQQTVASCPGCGMWLTGPPPALAGTLASYATAPERRT
jgi:hypothetical protein